MDIWTQVFAGQPDRLVRVIGGADRLARAGRPDPRRRRRLRPKGATSASSFDAYAVTGYFGGNLGSEIKAPMVKGWLEESRAAAEAAAGALTGAERSAFVQAHRFDLAVTRAATELRDGSLTGDGEDSLTRLLTEVLPHHAAAARDARAEAGDVRRRHAMSSAAGAMIDDPELTEFFDAPELHARKWARCTASCSSDGSRLTDAPFNAFVDVAGPSKWGSWGALRHLTDDNPRWQALASGMRGSAERHHPRLQRGRLDRALPAALFASHPVPGGAEVVVVANGCTDATARIARAASPTRPRRRAGA